MRIQSFIICVLMVGFIFTGFYTLADSLAGEDAYDVPLNESYKDSFDKTNNISTQISEDYENIVGRSDTNETGWVVDKLAYLALIPQAVSLVKNMIKLPVIVSLEMVESFTEYLNLPDWMAAFFITIIILSVIFGLIALVLRYRHT